MAIDKVREYFRQFGLEDKVMEFDVSSATVDLAAEAVGVEGARICKTMSFLKPNGEGAILVQMAGDGRVNNRKFKDQFGFKARCSNRMRFWNTPVTPSAAFVLLHWNVTTSTCTATCP